MSLVWLLLLEQSPPNDYGFMNGASGNITLAIEGISSFGCIRAMMVGFSFCFDKWTYLIDNPCRSDFGFFKKGKSSFVALINCYFTLLKRFSNSLMYSNTDNLLDLLYVSNVSYAWNLQIASFFYITYLT